MSKFIFLSKNFKLGRVFLVRRRYCGVGFDYILTQTFFRGHRGTIWSMVSKGHRLFSAGGDQVIKVWNMENVRLAKCTEVLEGHADDVSKKCFL